VTTGPSSARAIILGPRWSVRRPAARVRIAIALAEDAFVRIGEVLHACRAAGFEDEVTLASVGVITGVVAPDRLAALMNVPGVAAIELARTPAEERRDGPQRGF